jgi:hypothetical protein
LGSPEDFSTFGKKFVTSKGEKDGAWVPDNMRVAKLPEKAVGALNLSPVPSPVSKVFDIAKCKFLTFPFNFSHSFVRR